MPRLQPVGVLEHPLRLLLLEHEVDGDARRVERRRRLRRLRAELDPIAKTTASTERPSSGISLRSFSSSTMTASPKPKPAAAQVVGAQGREQLVDCPPPSLARSRPCGRSPRRRSRCSTRGRARRRCRARATCGVAVRGASASFHSSRSSASAAELGAEHAGERVEVADGERAEHASTIVAAQPLLAEQRAHLLLWAACRACRRRRRRRRSARPARPPSRAARRERRASTP